MLNRDCQLHHYRRGEVPDGVFNRLEFALSKHCGRAFEGLSFNVSEVLPQDSIGDMLGEMSLVGLWLTHEKAIGELKSSLAFATIPTNQYGANSAWQQLVALAHNLLPTSRSRAGRRSARGATGPPRSSW